MWSKGVFCVFVLPIYKTYILIYLSKLLLLCNLVKQTTNLDVLCFRPEEHQSKPKKNNDIFPFWIKKQRSLSRRIVKLTQRRQLGAVLKLLDDASRNNLKLNRVVMNSALAACVHCGDLKQAYALYKIMLQPGNCGVDSVTYNILIKGLSDNRMFDEAFELVESLENGTVPGKPLLMEVHVRTLLNGLAEAGEMMRACGVLSRYRSVLHRKGPSIFTYNILIKGFANSATPLEALKLREDMDRFGLQPGPVTFNSLIRACMHGGDLAKAMELFKEMKETAERLHSPELLPNIVTYTTLIQGFGQQGLFDGVVTLVKELKASKECVLDHVAYGVIIDAYVSSGSSSGLMEALSLLDEMLELSKENPQLRPKSHVFLSVMRAFAENGQVDVVERLRADMVPLAAGNVLPQYRAEADELLFEAAVNAGKYGLARKLLKDMKGLKKGMQLSSRAYSVLIRLELISNFSNLFRPYVLQERVSLDDPVEKWMTNLESFQPPFPNSQLSDVVMCFFRNAVLPILSEDGKCIGVVHREDCFELNQRLESLMRGAPPSVPTHTPTGKAITLLLESDAKMVAVVQPAASEAATNDDKLVGFLTLESVLSLKQDYSVLLRNRTKQVLMDVQSKDNVT